jgi:hypothetical protein
MLARSGTVGAPERRSFWHQTSKETALPLHMAGFCGRAALPCAEIFFRQGCSSDPVCCLGGFRLSKIGQASRVLHQVLAHFTLGFFPFPGAPSGCCFPDELVWVRNLFTMTRISSGTATWTTRNHLWGSRDKGWLPEDAISGAIQMHAAQSRQSWLHFERSTAKIRDRSDTGQVDTMHDSRSPDRIPDPTILH